MPIETAASYCLVLTTCASADEADRMAKRLVEAKLAACVNILPPMRSVYRWRAETQTATEHLLIAKIRVADYAAVEERIKTLHNYELPEVIAVPVVGGLSAYLAWLNDPDITT